MPPPWVRVDPDPHARIVSMHARELPIELRLIRRFIDATVARMRADPNGPHQALLTVHLAKLEALKSTALRIGDLMGDRAEIMDEIKADPASAEMYADNLGIADDQLEDDNNRFRNIAGDVNRMQWEWPRDLIERYIRDVEQIEEAEDIEFKEDELQDPEQYMREQQASIEEMARLRASGIREAGEAPRLEEAKEAGGGEAVEAGEEAVELDGIDGGGELEGAMRQFFEAQLRADDMEAVDRVQMLDGLRAIGGAAIEAIGAAAVDAVGGAAAGAVGGLVAPLLPAVVAPVLPVVLPAAMPAWPFAPVVVPGPAGPPSPLAVLLRRIAVHGLRLLGVAWGAPQPVKMAALALFTSTVSDIMSSSNRHLEARRLHHQLGNTTRDALVDVIRGSRPDKREIQNIIANITQQIKKQGSFALVPDQFIALLRSGLLNEAIQREKHLTGLSSKMTMEQVLLSWVNLATGGEKDESRSMPFWNEPGAFNSEYKDQLLNIGIEDVLSQLSKHDAGSFIESMKMAGATAFHLKASELLEEMIDDQVADSTLRMMTVTSEKAQQLETAGNRLIYAANLVGIPLPPAFTAAFEMYKQAKKNIPVDQIADWYFENKKKPADVARISPGRTMTEEETRKLEDYKPMEDSEQEIQPPKQPKGEKAQEEIKVELKPAEGGFGRFKENITRIGKETGVAFNKELTFMEELALRLGQNLRRIVGLPYDKSVTGSHWERIGPEEAILEDPAAREALEGFKKSGTANRNQYGPQRTDKPLAGAGGGKVTEYEGDYGAGGMRPVEEESFGNRLSDEVFKIMGFRKGGRLPDPYDKYDEGTEEQAKERPPLTEPPGGFFGNPIADRLFESFGLGKGGTFDRYPTPAPTPAPTSEPTPASTPPRKRRMTDNEPIPTENDEGEDVALPPPAPRKRVTARTIRGDPNQLRI